VQCSRNEANEANTVSAVKKGMKSSIMGISLAAVLALVALLPVTAQDDSSATITVTMTGASEFSINLEPTEWKPVGEEALSPDTAYETGITWSTLTVEGNCNVNAYVAGEDAVWTEDPGAYGWTLSSSADNGIGAYVLWFRVQGDERGYVLVPEPSEGSPGVEFYPSSLSPGPDGAKQFGLKLLTAEADFARDGVGYFCVGGATVETHVTISAVAA
jgi:hypothetical protein